MSFPWERVEHLRAAARSTSGNPARNAWIAQTIALLGLLFIASPESCALRGRPVSRLGDLRQNDPIEGFVDRLAEGLEVDAIRQIDTSDAPSIAARKPLTCAGNLRFPRRWLRIGGCAIGFHPRLRNLTFQRHVFDANRGQGFGATRPGSIPLHPAVSVTRGTQLMKSTIFTILAAAVFALAGCNRAESPAQVQQDVANAQAEGQRDITDAQADTQEELADAQRDATEGALDNDADQVADAAQDARETQAEGEFKVAVAQAEADHRIAIEKCEALSGDAQADCKDRADQALENAKRQAEARRDGAG